MHLYVPARHVCAETRQHAYSGTRHSYETNYRLTCSAATCQVSLFMAPGLFPCRLEDLSSHPCYLVQMYNTYCPHGPINRGPVPQRKYVLLL